MTCHACHKPFAVTERERDFLKKVSPQFEGEIIPIPEPTHCPDCRLQRRTSYRAEFYYYPRKCSCCQKSIVSIYPPEYPTPIYCYNCWWGDAWSPESYGRDFNFSRPFFPQFRELYKDVPQLTLVNDNGMQSENCEYTHDFSYGKNCYLVTATWHIDQGMYSTQCNYTREVVDCFFVIDQSELVYESSFSAHLYNCTFLVHSSGCSNCHFGYNLRECQECIGCVGLRQKRFCIFNKQYSEAEYRALSSRLKLDTRLGQRKFHEEYNRFRLTQPHKAVHQLKCEDCVGDALIECKDFEGFLVGGGQYSRNVWMGDKIVNCHDVINTGLPQWCYEGNTPDESYQCHFTIYCWKDKNLLYCDSCHSSEYLLGCIGLRRKTHCIFNRSYTAHEYEKLAKKILSHMKETGEWGEFFPMRESPFYYNESRAMDAFPLTESEAKAKGLQWRDPPALTTSSTKLLPPESLDGIDEGITTSTFSCESCSRSYKILKLEYSFYKKMGLPPPALCPHCRRKARFDRFPSMGKMFNRACHKCSAPVSTAFSAERKEIVFCESCYRESD